MTTTYHVGVGIEGALSRADLDGWFSTDGVDLSDDQARIALLQLKAQGFSYFTGAVCDRMSPEGVCLGHVFETVSGLKEEVTRPTGIRQIFSTVKTG